MSDKKNDDLPLRSPRGGSPLNGNGDAGRFAPKQQHQAGASLKASWASIEENGTVAVLAYCFASTSMTLVNKFVVSGNSWNLHLLYLAIQHIIVTVAVVLMQQLGIISGVDLYNPSKAKKWFPIALMLVTMIFTGNKALQFLSVPVYTIFKNLAVVVIAYGEVIWFNGSVSPLSLVSFILMVLSSVLAAWSDFSDAKSSAANSRLSTLNAGYFWMLINVLAASTYALGMRGGMKKINLKNWDVIYYNNVLTIPLLLGGSLFLEDWSSANLERNFPPAARQSLIIGMIYSGLGALLISYCTAWCIRATSSTTYAMSGALNKLPMAIAGLVFFKEPVTFGGVVAILMGFVSGVLYSVAKTSKPKEKTTDLPLTNLPQSNGQHPK
ncbi:unnamed protein product [Clonostachys byssicola]|uniref:GDP-mannose transporter n=1 Tax=Clonostachys byssicola TaxID=160290 RepID=A0A9N9UWJ0_9HYPO|nr:unnamed protein product [Clonostachys byssicola]